MSDSLSEGGRLVHDLYAAINKQDIEALARVFVEDIDYVDFGLGKRLKGKDEIRKHFKNWWTAFPKGSGEIVNLIILGDQVVAEIVGRGDQTGPFEMPQGRVEASNRPFEFHFCQLYRIKSGKISEWRTYSDAAKIAASASLRKVA